MTGERGALGRRWRTTWSDLGLEAPAGAFEDLLARYSEPHRAYHTGRHLLECFEQFEPARALAADPGSVQLALWFHDAVYDPRGSTNEEESARLARDALARAGAAAAVQDRVEASILATRHRAAPGSADAMLTVDVDLSILGAPVARFEEYESQIRDEYAWVPEAIYAVERTKILRGFLARDRIYATDWFRDALEARARANLHRSIDRHGAPPAG
jgi:predicted metal-dependent HD superfamily phosphohydrolase